MTLDHLAHLAQTMTHTQCFVWHLTKHLTDASEGGTPESIKEMKDDVRSIAKKWAFQVERGEEKGTLHWQMVISLHKKRRQNELVALLRKTKFLKGAHVSVASNASGGSDAYVMKADTRVAGPWTSDDEPDEEPEPEPEQLKGISLFPWQARVIEFLQRPWDRDQKIMAIEDRIGQNGKSTLFSYLGWKKIAQTVGTISDPEKVSAAILSMPRADAYAMDIARMSGDDGVCRDKKKMYAIWRSIETVASGYCFDTRYKYRERHYTNPKIVVYFNEAISEMGSVMSNGRLMKMMIDHEGKLCEWTKTRSDHVFKYMLAKRRWEEGERKKKSASEHPADKPIVFIPPVEHKAPPGFAGQASPASQASPAGGAARRAEGDEPGATSSLEGIEGLVAALENMTTERDEGK